MCFSFFIQISEHDKDIESLASVMNLVIEGYKFCGRYHVLSSRSWLCHKWPWMCSIYLIFNTSNTSSAFSVAGTTYPSEAHEFNAVFCVCISRKSLIFCVVCCKSFSFFFWQLYCLVFNLRLLYLPVFLVFIYFLSIVPIFHKNYESKSQF